MSRSRWLAVVLCVLVVVAAGLRLYRLDELIVFLGDQGRDVTAVQTMIETGRPALLGPGSSFGQFRRGPAYYYLLLPALWITQGEPLSAGVFIALADAAAVGLVFLLARSLGGTYAGLAAAALYACALTPIQVARGFSNPSLLPILTLGMLYALWRVVQGQDRYLILVGALWLVAWQLHDQVWLLIPFFGLILILFRPQVRWSTVGWLGVCALVILAPLLWYEAQHGASNTRLMIEYVRGFLVNPARENGITTAPTRLFESVNLLYSAFSSTLWVRGIWALALAASLVVLVRQARSDRRALYLSAVAFIPLLYAVWPGPIYALNVAILLPIPFLVLGFGFGKIPPGMWQHAGAIALVLICAVNAVMIGERLRVTAPTRSSYLTARQATADILARTGGAPFVFEMFVEPQTEAFASPYLYLLKRAGAAVTTQGDAMRVQVYDPATLAEGQGGEIFQTIRVVTFAPPLQLGPNLLDAEWNLHKRVVVNAENELELTAAEVDDAMSATQRLPLKANATYLLQFECRNALEQGDQRVYLQTLNAAGDVVQTFPNGAGYDCPKTAEWKQGSILVRTAAETKRSIIFLRLYGVGTVWFRNVRLQKTSLEQLP